MTERYYTAVFDKYGVMKHRFYGRTSVEAKFLAQLWVDQNIGSYQDQTGPWQICEPIREVSRGD